jgi:glycosyltransferase involved in cell wall biosynthesis
MIVLPYKQVTQCGPLLIGYSENIPAIVSDQPGFREYADDGNSALIFDNSAEGLAQKMEQVINDPAMLNRMSEYIKNTIRDKYGMQVLAEDYIKNFRECKVTK